MNIHTTNTTNTTNTVIVELIGIKEQSLMNLKTHAFKVRQKVYNIQLEVSYAIWILFR